MASPNSIFISYRRSDSSDITGRIYDRLRGHFGREVIFKDVDSIPYGADIREHLNQSVGRCKVFIAIIGSSWVKEMEERSDASVLDWVIEETRIALSHGIPVIPLLVKGANMPRESSLPESIRAIAYLNAARARTDPDFHSDMDRLISHLEAAIGQTTSSAQREHKAEKSRAQNTSNAKHVSAAQGNSTRGDSGVKSAFKASERQQPGRHLWGFFERVPRGWLFFLCTLITLLPLFYLGLAGLTVAFICWLAYFRSRNISFISVAIVSILTAQISGITLYIITPGLGLTLSIGISAAFSVAELAYSASRVKDKLR